MEKLAQVERKMNSVQGELTDLKEKAQALRAQIEARKAE